MTLFRLLRSSAASNVARDFSTLKRAKPIRVKSSESRRVISKAPKPTDALNLAPAPPPSANMFVPSEQQTPQTFGGVMKESFFWGLGMAAAFSVVGIIFSSMEETNAPGEFKDSFVVVSQDDQ